MNSFAELDAGKQLPPSDFQSTWECILAQSSKAQPSQPEQPGKSSKAEYSEDVIREDVNRWLYHPKTVALLHRAWPMIRLVLIEARKTRRLILQTADAITPKRVRWLWPGCIPKGKATAWSGKAGIGKSLIAVCDLIARITTGRDWPDGQENTSGPQDAVILCTEDDYADTIVPRLMAAGADLSRVHAISAVRDASQKDHPFSLESDIPLLKARIKALSNLGIKVAYVVIDPGSSYVRHADMNKGQAIRQEVMEPLGTFAEACDCAVVVIWHFNKKVDVTDALYRTGGSEAIVSASRAAWVTVPSPDDADLYLLFPAKINNAKRGDGLAYRIGERRVTIEGVAEPIAVIEWQGSVPMTANDVLTEAADPKGRENKRKERDDAKTWLHDYLEKNGETEAGKVRYAAKWCKHHIADTTLDRAARGLGVVKSGSGPKTTWALPSE